MAYSTTLTFAVCLLLILHEGFSKTINKETSEAEDAIGAGYQQKWGYVDVRPRAHMFWWLYYTSHPEGHMERPLVMWLNGGPGAGSTGYGNFVIMGPQDTDLNPRNTTWVQEVSVLYVDNPVGAGFSYVESEDAFTTDVDEIAIDLLTLYKEFLRANPDFKTVPFYIFGQSYGGKMAAAFAKRLHAAIRAGELESKFAGFAMGNAWISPVDSTMTWGPLLYWMSTVDEPGLADIQKAATACKDAADAGQWQLSTDRWRQTQAVLGARSNYVDFYDILKFRIFSSEMDMKSILEGNDTWMEPLVSPSPYATDIYTLMNTKVKQHLKIIPENVSWGGQRGMVFKKQEGDFMKPVIKIVDELLKETDMEVIVYQGQLDLICDTKGAMDWVQKLTWSGLANYNSAERLALVDPVTKQTDTFVKAHKQFKFYWNLRKGHAVPENNAAALRMLKRITSKTDK